ncbi:hypothetical protein COT72_01470 [archaeon CG10_big_fil_rev_8_21_14_0_10_43_11]|nr:MAG: hypothetical protein COT72_01470 [archaeon CG10_big_fil_rev_8_21_14_0_10_43_11]
MRVGIIAWEYPPKHSGGLGVHLEGLISELKHCAELVVFMPARNAPKTIAGVELVTFESDTHNHDFIADVNQKIVDYVKTHPLDILHAQDWVSYHAAISVKNLGLCPVVCSIHSTIHDRSGRFVREKNQHKTLEKKGLDAADAVITVSEYTKKQLVRDFSIPAQKITVIPNAIRLEDVSKTTKKRKDVLFLGRITEQKGLEYVLYALRNSPHKLIVLGDGHLADATRSFAKLIGAHAEFRGFVREKKVIFDALKNARAFVMPSVSEPFGIVALEAFAAKCPAILSKYSGVSDFLQDKLHALIIDPHKPQEIIDALACLDDEQFASKLAHNAYHLLEEGTFSWERVAKKTCDVYASILNI